MYFNGLGSDVISGCLSQYKTRTMRIRMLTHDSVVCRIDIGRLLLSLWLPNGALGRQAAIRGQCVDFSYS